MNESKAVLLKLGLDEQSIKGKPFLILQTFFHFQTPAAILHMMQHFSGHKLNWRLHENVYRLLIENCSGPWICRTYQICDIKEIYIYNLLLFENFEI